LPIAPDADQWARLWNEVKEIARTAGRDPNAVTGAMYLTVVIDEDSYTAISHDSQDHNKQNVSVTQVVLQGSRVVSFVGESRRKLC
jgi:hypothetical protein